VAPFSEGIRRRLQLAGQDVKNATESLVEVARAMHATNTANGCHHTDVQINDGMVHNMSQLLSMENDIINKEKELQNSRQSVLEMRREQRRLKPEFPAVTSLVDVARKDHANHDAIECHDIDIQVNLRQLLSIEADIIKKERELQSLNQKVVELRQKIHRLNHDLHSDNDVKLQ
jgi:chromosome segregation ATPase